MPALTTFNLHSGLWGSIIGMILIAWMSVYTMKLLTRVKEHLGLEGVSFPELITRSFPPKYGGIVGKIVYGMIVVTIMGACTIYLVLCGGLIADLFGWNVKSTFWQVLPIGIMGVLLTVMSYIPDLRKISGLR